MEVPLAQKGRLTKKGEQLQRIFKPEEGISQPLDLSLYSWWRQLGASTLLAEPLSDEDIVIAIVQEAIKRQDHAFIMDIIDVSFKSRKRGVPALVKFIQNQTLKLQEADVVILCNAIKAQYESNPKLAIIKLRLIASNAGTAEAEITQFIANWFQEQPKEWQDMRIRGYYRSSRQARSFRDLISRTLPQSNLADFDQVIRDLSQESTTEDPTEFLEKPLMVDNKSDGYIDVD